LDQEERSMNLVTLQRQAPVAPDADRCELCDKDIHNTLQDHLLVGQPGTAGVRAAICPGCGEVIARLAQLLGPEVTLLVQNQRPAESARRLARQGRSR
jgi:hypothetical protein